MKDFLINLFKYNHTCNQQLVTLLNSNKDNITEKSLKLFSHILNAHEIWNARIEAQQPSCGVWDIRNITDLPAIDELNYENTIRILNTLPPGKNISYSNTKGESFSNTIQDILFHAINHSTYHRAQIATECKSNGISPLATDYILFKR